VQKRLNWSRCRLGCGLRWAQEITCNMRSRFPHGKGQFVGKGAPIVKCWDFKLWAVQMAELIDLSFGLWTLVSRRKHKFSRIHPLAPMCTSSIVIIIIFVFRYHFRFCQVGGHIGATCIMQLSSLSKAMLWPYVILLWPLVIMLTEGHLDEPVTACCSVEPVPDWLMNQSLLPNWLLIINLLHLQQTIILT